MSAFMIRFLDYNNNSNPVLCLSAGDTAEEAIQSAVEAGRSEGKDLAFLPDYDCTAKEITEDDLSEPNSLEEFQALPSERLIYMAENAELPYSKADFLRLCKGDVKVAYRLYTCCEWQCPETVLDEDSLQHEGEQSFPTCH